MNLFEAIFLGFIQGLTEFLPVSSSGHLAIFQKIFGLQEVGISFDIVLHVGTLIAVFVVYWKDIWRLIVDGIGIIVDCVINVVTFIKSKINHEEAEYRKVISTPYRKFALLVIVSTIPTGIIGIVGGDLVDAASKTLIVPGICLIITAVLLFISDNLPDGEKTPKKTTYPNAIFMGICQGIATLPGLSRSGTTIASGLVCGLRRDFAVKYSFIMSIPAIMGAAVIEIPKMSTDTHPVSGLACFAGALVAAIVGYVCIKTMLVIVRKKKFKYFSYYCAVIGVVSIIASFIVK